MDRLSISGVNVEGEGPGVSVLDPGQVEASRLENEHPIPDHWRQSNSKSDNLSIGVSKRFARSKRTAL